MQGTENTTTNDGRSAFWKKNLRNVPGSIRPVYGAAHPPRTEPSTPKRDSSRTHHKRNSSSSSFQDFQESTDDAWDVGDDDFCVVSNVIHPKVAQSTALTVISNHSGRSRAITTGHTRSASAGEAGITRKTGGPHLSEVRTTAIQRLAVQSDPSCHSHHPVSNNVPSHPPQGPGRGVRQSTVPPISHHMVHLKYLQSRNSQREVVRLKKFKSLLNGPNTDLEELKELSWAGIPPAVRPITWRLLAGYLPANNDRRESTLERKREEYFNYIKQYYNTRLQDVHQETYRQIHIDIPRMSPLVPLFQQQLVQEIFERILYIWAIRHPASGYVQGMNDLVTPFFVVFLQELVPSGSEVETYDVTLLPKGCLDIIEADSYWCLTKLLDGIQENYTFAQPGIQKKVNTLKDLMKRIDAPLHNHLEHHSVEYLQFSFRWMNNLLMRELPLKCTVRLWDTYLSETDGFSTFHLYVCAAFLKHWSRDLLAEKDFQGIMLMLQNLPTLNWGDEEISLLVAEAYQLKFTFADAPNHLQREKK
ncbi:TBC1 domain family member 22B-like isoform X1 [Limulus polyphemus]|uniref:TBC1 domain family member 22B-like isoform X1 n=1 Tax=Limulus polyphemus TaxID=6850 RepID=A0ABM1SH90_LIMPO|nr:TBC1 domain family member 22B-like isoform X1 [Limulus polyphemus]XP_022242996.1 TBC1 domain family member 22B-like isoform X1 [Limulus polyphemus]